MTTSKEAVAVMPKGRRQKLKNKFRYQANLRKRVLVEAAIKVENQMGNSGPQNHYALEDRAKQAIQNYYARRSTKIKAIRLAARMRTEDLRETKRRTP